MPIQDDARYVRIAPLAGTDCWSVVGRAARRLATRENVPGSSPRRGIGKLGSVEFIVLAPSSWSDERQTAGRKNRTRLAGLASPIGSTTSPNTKQGHSVIHVTAHSPVRLISKNVQKRWWVRTKSGGLSRPVGGTLTTAAEDFGYTAGHPVEIRDAVQQLVEVRPALVETIQQRHDVVVHRVDQAR
jgi:hypothetical protein